MIMSGDSRSLGWVLEMFNSKLALRKRAADQSIYYGRLWEEQAHHIRVKEPTKEGVTSNYNRALDRWNNDPEFALWQGPGSPNYTQGKEQYMQLADGVIQKYLKPVSQMSAEESDVVELRTGLRTLIDRVFQSLGYLVCSDSCVAIHIVE